MVLTCVSRTDPSHAGDLCTSPKTPITVSTVFRKLLAECVPAASQPFVAVLPSYEMAGMIRPCTHMPKRVRTAIERIKMDATALRNIYAAFGVWHSVRIFSTVHLHESMKIRHRFPERRRTTELGELS